MSNTPSWIPDWTKESNYPTINSNVKTLDKLDDNEIEQLAWEFLRRNPRYQADYNKYFSPHYGSDEEVEGELERGEIAMFPYLVCEPPSFPKETYPQYLKRMFGMRWEILSRHQHIAEKYGLALSPIDPKIENPFLIGFATGSSPSIQASSGNGSLEHYAAWKLEKASDAFVKFDLNLPIKPQIDRVKALLERRQRSLKNKGVIAPYNGKVELRLLSHFLRILDADSYGIKPTIIASVLEPKKSNIYPDYLATDSIKKSLIRAVYLRDEGYKYFSLKNNWR